MSVERYFNTEPYPLIKGDTNPPYVFSIYDSDGAPADLSSYGSLVVTGRVREEGSATSLAAITCTAVDASIGQFKVPAWPSAVTSADEGILELEIELDYLGDATQVQTVYNLVQFRLYEQFGAVV